MNSTRIVLQCVAAAILSLAAGAATAATTPRHESFTWPSHPRNLEVLPKDIRPEQLRTVMTGFTKALGVHCVFCHVGTEGSPLSAYNFSSDRKSHKRIARGMMRMTRQINRELDAIRADEERAHASRTRGGSEDRDERASAREEDGESREHGNVRTPSGGHEEEEINVECATCHRGASEPRLQPTRAAGDADRDHDEPTRRSR